MPLLKLESACLAFGHVPLLDHVDFQLDEGERVALIGRNGAGKSSMLRALAGIAALDDGKAWQQPGLRLAYVPQEPAFAPGATAEGCLSAVFAARQKAQEAEGLWDFRHRVAQLLADFSLPGATPVDALSGGQKKRLALAQAFAAEPEALLLDEPTNHLDIAAIGWLEKLLLSSRMALLFITHDRVFLDRLATRVAELDRGLLADFPGNFAEYQKRKEAQLADEAVQNRKFDKKLKEEEAWIRKGVEARRTRAVFRVQRLERLRAARAARRERQGDVKLKVDAGEKSGELVVELKDVEKRFGEKTVVRGFSCRILRGDKVGLIGPNGAGKTTLLRLILGEISPDAGTVRRGTKLSVAYFDQFRTQLDEGATLAEVISPGSDFVEIHGAKKHVIGYLEDFLFPPERARAKVGSLSGGEKNRLLLARLFSLPANVLVLDEPTNDLDLETLELLESLLQDYTGTLFLVSHDRAFLDNVATQSIAAEGDGRWREYIGGYSDWERQRPQEAPEGKPGGAPKKAKAAAEKPEAPVRKKLSWKESRELEALPGRIAALEGEQKQLEESLSDPAFYQDPEKARQAAGRLPEIEAELLALLERWEALEAQPG